MIRIFSSIFLVIGCIAVSACASSDKGYPSLAIRDVERQAALESASQTNIPSAHVPTPTPMDPALTRRLDQLLASAKRSHNQFMAAVPAAQNAVRNGGRASLNNPAKESALIALANLDSIRSQTTIPLADLDRLYTDAAVMLAQEPQISAVRNQIDAMVAIEDVTLARLRAQAPL